MHKSPKLCVWIQINNNWEIVYYLFDPMKSLVSSNQTMAFLTLEWVATIHSCLSLPVLLFLQLKKMVEQLEFQDLGLPFKSKGYFAILRDKPFINTKELSPYSSSHCFHRLLWAFIMMGSTGLAIYSSLSIYFAWQAPQKYMH